jgi:molybdopterin-binding protein
LDSSIDRFVLEPPVARIAGQAGHPRVFDGYWQSAYRFGSVHCRPGASGADRSLKEGVAMGITAINIRNQFKGRIKEIIRGSVVSEIDVQTPFGIVTSAITTRSVDELDLQVGSEVVALVKATEVSIARL